jgi:hypothetical protein
MKGCEEMKVSQLISDAGLLAAADANAEGAGEASWHLLHLDAIHRGH